MHFSARRWRWWLAGIIVAIPASVILVYALRAPTDPPPSDPFPLTPISSSPYLNTKDGHYVGSDVCRKCHEDRHASFRTTGMGRSMDIVNLKDEPPDASFEHAKSRRRYEVRRRDGQMWHRELLMTDGPEVLLAEYPMKYVVGSGRHSRTYLVEAEGFLVESPVTWYSAKKSWGMSPGYDHPDQDGFERPTGDGCLHCHAGRAEPIGGSLHKMMVHEPAIACERCHGPGSLHIEKHKDRGAPNGHTADADLTIVNPSRLSRDLAEAICQQCHLRSTAMVAARGRKFSDFRPGMPLSDMVHSYMLETPERKMTVVGHVEQMHLSRCYQSSTTLTCLTCHSPHSEPAEDAKVAHYQAVCTQCHKPEQCTVDPTRRTRESPANDCVRCHMPKSPTEIPHLAFTHHRIGIHSNEKKDLQSKSSDADLNAFFDLSRFTTMDQKRSLGLGYLEAAAREKDRALAERLRARSLDFLSDVHAKGLRDGGLEAGLARVRHELIDGDWVGYARLALEQPNLDGGSRCMAMFMIAESDLERKRYADAVRVLRELTQLRRDQSDWLRLADCERNLGNHAATDDALLHAVQINPRLWRIHEHLAEQFQRKGDSKRAEFHRLRAVP